MVELLVFVGGKNQTGVRRQFTKIEFGGGRVFTEFIKQDFFTTTHGKVKEKQNVKGTASTFWNNGVTDTTNENGNTTMSSTLTEMGELFLATVIHSNVVNEKENVAHFQTIF
jgi:hypothetical protein